MASSIARGAPTSPRIAGMPEPDLLAWVVRLAEALRTAGVPHALAGGLALAVHGQPRATTDIDFVITSDPDAIARARKVLADLGILQTRRPIVRFQQISLLRVIAAPASSPEPIAIGFIVPPPELDAVLDRAVVMPVMATEVAVVSPEDLVLLKLLRSSAQDLVDIAAMAANHPLDRAYLARLARALRITPRLRKALPRRR